MFCAVSSRFFAVLALLFLFQFDAHTAAADGARLDTPSGLPVPRFVSLRYGETNCRAGPSFAYPVSIRFMRAGTPVLIVAETRDHWRKVRDSDGAECWAHQTTLAARDHVLVLQETPLRAAPSETAPPKARLAAGLLAEFESRKDGWARVKAAGVAGWVDVDALWGVDAAARK